MNDYKPQETTAPNHRRMSIKAFRAWFLFLLVQNHNKHIFNLPTQRWAPDHVEEIGDGALIFRSEYIVHPTDEHATGLIYKLQSNSLDFTTLGETTDFGKVLVDDVKRLLCVVENTENGLIKNFDVKIEEKEITITFDLVTPLQKRLFN